MSVIAWAQCAGTAYCQAPRAIDYLHKPIAEEELSSVRSCSGLLALSSAGRQGSTTDYELIVDTGSWEYPRVISWLLKMTLPPVQPYSGALQELLLMPLNMGIWRLWIVKTGGPGRRLL